MVSRWLVCVLSFNSMALASGKQSVSSKSFFHGQDGKSGLDGGLNSDGSAGGQGGFGIIGGKGGNGGDANWPHQPGQGGQGGKGLVKNGEPGESGAQRLPADIKFDQKPFTMCSPLEAINPVSMAVVGFLTSYFEGKISDKS